MKQDAMKIIAHRGFSGKYLENTLDAFENAVGVADIIEMDLQITKDKQIVIYHDRSLKRLHGLSTGIADHTVHELQNLIPKYNVKNAKNPKIPTLEEALNFIPEKQSIILEVKPQRREIEENHALDELIMNNLEKIHRQSLGEYGYISVRDIPTYLWFKEHSSFSIGLMQKKRSEEEFIELVKKYNIIISQIRIGSFSKAGVQKLKNLKSKVYVFYADTENEFAKMFDWGVDGIFTNYPNKMKNYLMGLNKNNR